LGPPATYVLVMVAGATIAATAALLLTGSVGAAAPGANASRVLWQGPTFAGDAVVWGEEAGGNGSLHLWTQRRGDRAVYRSDSFALGRPLAASGTLVGFERTYPSCAPQPNRVCPQATETVIGPRMGPFKRLVRPRTCFLPTVGSALALDGGVAAYLELDCEHERLQVVVRDVAHHGGPIVLRETALSGGCCSEIAIAGRHVAWIDGGDVVVYDRVAHRTAYRARIGPAGIGVDLGFDLQRDGKVAVAYRPVEFARAGQTTVAWLPPSAPHLHALGLRGRDTRIRIAGNRIAFERYLTTKRSALVVADLTGHARTVARFAPPTRLRSGFDFDGRRIVWASDRVTATRTDCPPPGQGRPCVQRESGITTIWLKDVQTGTLRVVARLPFVDTVAHP
jgi:hypothetical protein